MDKNVVYTHTHTHHGIYSDIKNNKILPFAITWVDLEGIMQSEISRTEKDKYHMTSLLCANKKAKSNKTETDS